MNLKLYDYQFSLFFFRLRSRDIYKLITLTDSFTWEELPTRHPDTGHTTKAGYIQKIPFIGKYAATFILVFHCIQCTVRMVRSREMIYSKWYPFDVTVSPAYELANLSQVMLNMNMLRL
jgi:hypothetical protein